MKELSVSIVITALNDEDNLQDAIESTLGALDQLGLKGELLVVDDGSTDRTSEVARSIAERDDRVICLRHETNRGQGAAFITGLAVARYEAFTLFPGDNEMLAAEILLYVEELRRVDMVVPWVVNADIRSPVRRLLSKAYMKLVRHIFGLGVRYPNGSVLYRTAVLRDVEIKCQGFAYQTELLTKLSHRGYLAADVPYYIATREGGSATAVRSKTVVQLVRSFAGLAADVYFGGAAKPVVPGSARAERDALAQQQLDARRSDGSG